ncbi:hypothetical protein ACLK1S_15415 [Escherichia coli]
MLNFALVFPNHTVSNCNSHSAGHRDCPLEKMVSEALVLMMKTSPIHHKADRHFRISNKRYGEASQERR